MEFSRQEYWSGLLFPPLVSMPVYLKKKKKFFVKVFTLHSGAVGASQVVIVVKNYPVNAGDARDVGSIPELQRSPLGRHGNSRQYYCLENAMDRKGWLATVHRVAQSWT